MDSAFSGAEKVGSFNFSRWTQASQIESKRPDVKDL